MELIPRSGNERICTFIATCVSIDRTANTMTIDGGTHYGVMANVKIHFHCENPFELVEFGSLLVLSESESTVANGHKAFHEGDCVRVLGLPVGDRLPTAAECYVIGFRDFRRRCYPPAGCHLSGGLISGAYGSYDGNYDCGNTDMAFGPYLSQSYDNTKVYQTIWLLERGQYRFWNDPGADHYEYVECAICPPFQCANLLDTTDPDTVRFAGVMRGWEFDAYPDNNVAEIELLGASLDGIALTENCRLELYTSVNFENHLISFTGPGIWNTSTWNWEGLLNSDGNNEGNRAEW